MKSVNGGRRQVVDFVSGKLSTYVHDTEKNELNKRHKRSLRSTWVLF